MPAEASLAANALPIGLAQSVRLNRAVARDELIRWSDVDIELTSQAVTIRREMEAAFFPLEGRG